MIQNKIVEIEGWKEVERNVCNFWSPCTLGSKLRREACTLQLEQPLLTATRKAGVKQERPSPVKEERKKRGKCGEVDNLHIQMKGP